MSRIRTLEFLPSIFQTPTNSQFLGATLDQLVNPPVSKTIQGYIGSKLGYGIDAENYYVPEPTKERTDYQLEPGVAFLKENETTAKDFISYPGIVNSLKLQNGITDNNNDLFTSQIYSFDPFCSYDPIINFNQYYWLPFGLPAVRVAASTVYTTNDYIVTYTSNGYNIKVVGSGISLNNPTLTLLRGGTYNFIVNQNSQFWIQGEPGVTGYSPIQPNLYTRDVYGVDNNGASVGVVTFNVPQANAQDDYIFPGNNTVGLACTQPFANINGMRLSEVGSIDGVTSLNGRTVMFYDTGITDEIGYVSTFYSQSNWDTNTGNLVLPETITVTATDNTGNITVSDIANLYIENTITFTGTSVGGLQPYDSTVPSIIPATSMTAGNQYIISDLSVVDTDWVSAGVLNNATLSAEIVGTQLIVDSVISGAFAIGQTLTGAGVTPGTTITDYDVINTAINGKPTYTVSVSQTVSLTTMSVYDIQVGKIFTCATVPSIGANGLVQPYTPVIYYITNIDTITNTIQVSETLNGPAFVTTTDTGTMTAYINQGLYEEGYYTTVADNFYLIEYVGDMSDPVLQLTPYATIPVDQKITPQYGTVYIGLGFVKYSSTGVISLIPYISAPLDTLYYQDGTNPNNVGKIRLIENNLLNTIDVEADILGKTNYTAPNGVVFTNGLKVDFDGDVVPRSYLEGEYYVEGVGVGIELIPVETLIVPEPFTTSTPSPYDIASYDMSPYDAVLNIPSEQDYITIARNSICKNAWARSNRWFHVDVINATATYNNNPEIPNIYATAENKAKRPIIQFYPNLKLYNSGTIGKTTVDFIDFRTTDALNLVENQQNYYPDVQTYTTYTGTINENTSVYVNDIIVGQWYEIITLGTTNSATWVSLGAELYDIGYFDVGTEYIITDLGTATQLQWNAIAGTVGETYAVGDKFVAVTIGIEDATGSALKTLFKSITTGDVPSDQLIPTLQYTITKLGTTQWQNIGASATPYIGELFTATDVAVGTGTAVQGTGYVKNKSITTVEIGADQVTGTLSMGQWINDLILGEASKLPVESRILSISGTTTYTITVYWPNPSDVVSGTNASFVANTVDNADLSVFPGCRIVFANDINESVKNKVYEINFNNTGSETYPVITLTEAYDSEVLENDQFPIQRGFNYKGTSFYYMDGEYVQAQQKQTVNQAPLFDVFDNNGISLGNSAIYNSTTFKGSKLFNYQLGTGADDTVLGFPISYSSFSNVNDIRFEVSLYTDQFNYVTNGNSITEYINQGYVHNFVDRTTYNRLIGWQTAIAPSQQYQVFQFSYYANAIPTVLAPGETIDFTVTCDVPQLSIETTKWPSLQVFNNNNALVEGTDYTVENTDTETKITVILTEDIDTVIQVMILSDAVSETAYYSIPVNLSNNPFNSNPTYIDLGDIRGQYQSIFNNNPNMVGTMFGANNYRDLGNMVPYGNRIIQNSASLVLPGTFLRNPETNLFDSLLFNSREYIKFKTLLVDTINRIAYEQRYDASSLLDQAMDEITAAKSQELPFFWSDMLPNKAAYITNVYSFFNELDTSIYPLSKIYDFETANYNGVLVYLQRTIHGVVVTKQLIKGIDYDISATSPNLTMTLDLITGDKVIIKEYNATYGSYVPNTPTKLGLYPATIPKVIYDESYAEPTWFIVGHDGSYTKMYGDYNEVLGMPIDFRDQILLEYETRVYNNLKLSRTLPIVPAALIPGYFRNTALSYDQYTDIYSTNFLDWVGQNRIDYKTQLYLANDPWSYNYRGSTFNLDTSYQFQQGNWRGIYTYLFDTATPNSTPWEMIGYTDKPSWWESQYGPAPYTSDNLILWTDMENGYDYNNGEPIEVDIFKRPGLLNILPVDSAGDLKNPWVSVIGNYNQFTFRRDWIVGDDAPAEYSYRKSSTYPFDLMRLQALIKPAMFYNLGVDLDNYKYNEEFNQFLVNGRTHLVPSDIEIYGNGTAKTSYVNWIVDYQKQLGVDATTKITTLLDNLDVRLVHRLAGFSDKQLLKFFVEKGSPTSPNPSLLIPDESYQVLLYNNQPSDKIIYSGVIVQKLTEGYAVYGNNQTSAYFKILDPVINGARTTIVVEDMTVSVADNYGPNISLIPYGTYFYTEEEVSQFLLAYGRYLESQGMKFETQNNGIISNWTQMIYEFLYWSQSGWSINSVITLNPAADNITIDKESLVVQPLTYSGTNFILNNNLYPIQNKDLNIVRDGTAFDVTPLNEGDALTYGQFDLSNIEHGIVFNNVTLFGDVIYNLITGLKQNRVYVRGTKSAEWNGTLFASGFIYNQDNIENWKAGVKYTQGSIVKYKNKYFTALKIVQPNSKFLQNEWKETDYDQIQKGLLPNSSTRSYESSLYYNADKANLEQDADLLSFSLIGYRPRDYMVSADLTDITQVNVYKNLIKDKGTLNAMKAFQGANLPQGGINYDIYENWAILQGTYGGILNNNFVEFRLSEKLLTGNPSIIGFTDGNNVDGVQQLVPIYALSNYGRSVSSPNILPLTIDQPSNLFSTAGYVNRNDVKMAAFYYTGLPAAVDANGIVVPINQLYVNEYVWLANYRANWQVMTPVSIGQVIQVSGNLNNTSTVTFNTDHNLSKYDIIAIINFDDAINGYFVVTDIVSAKQVLINLVLPSQTRTVSGQGIGLKFQSHRVAQPSDVQNLPLLNNEFVKNTVWVDENEDGGWAVYRKGINYQYDREFNKVNSVNFGSAVAYSTLSDYLIADSGAGNVYRYQYDALTKEYNLDQTLTQDISFGTTIAHEQNIYAVSQPTTTPTVFLYTVNNITVSDNIIPYQTILASDIDPSITRFGDAVAISGDTNWLFISDFDDINRNNVHVYRKRNTLVDAGSMVSGKTYQITEVGTVNWTELTNEVISNTAGVYFVYNGAAVTGTGTAIRCDYEYIDTITSASIEADKFGKSISTNYYGTVLVVGAPNEDYELVVPNINNWGRSYVYNRLVQNFAMDTQYSPTTSPEYTLTWTPNLSQPISVTKNGIQVDSSEYTIVGNVLTYTGVYIIGDILNVSGNEFALIQVLDTGEAPTIGAGFGTSVDNNTHATEIVVGAPFSINSTSPEGGAFRFTNGGARFGVIIGTNDTDVTTNRTILLNGYAVTITAGDANNAANIINNANITNVQASASNGKLVISLINQDIAVAEHELVLTVTDIDSLTELGITVYTSTQVIECPHDAGHTQFGTIVKFNEYNSIAISAPIGTRFAQTTFDFTDDENLDNDTVFDNNSTQYIDSYPNAGAVYTFDYLGNYNESLANIGAYTYAQSVNARNQINGPQPRYGFAIDWQNDKIIVGAPHFLPEDVDGQAIIYVNETGAKDWSVYRQSNEIVDINKIENIQLFSAETNNTLMNLDYIDPMQGKILGVARQNIDVISNIDPANYNNTALSDSRGGIVWGEAQVGTLWFNTSGVRFINYHQNDNTYNAKYWGTVFPGSDVAVYSWIASTVEPALYQGPGTVLDAFTFTVQTSINASNTITPMYYFWVRNTGIVFSQRGKNLADVNIESYILNPLQSGISYLAPLASDAVALYNCKPYINANDTILNIGYSNGTESNPSHQEFNLIRENYADDFLPGLPTTADYLVPESLYDRFLDSMSGVDEQGDVVPNPFLPKAVQSGILARPRQSFFYNRYAALKNYIQYANEVMALYPITEIREQAINGFLQSSGTYYDTTVYWTYVNWWAVGYDDNTKAVLQVNTYGDLSVLSSTTPTNTIVAVLQGQNQNSETETYRYDGDGVWTRIGLNNGTIQFSSYLYDYESAGYGFDGTFYDTDPYDTYPSEETRWIVRALTEQIYTDELLIHRNKSLILLFKYIQEETVENQNYLPWLNKTSLVDVSHTIRNLKPLQNYRSDNQEFLSGYVNETKPYHVVIKEFLFKYTGGDLYPGTITDFDLPAVYDTTIDNFVSPQLVYSTPTTDYQFEYATSNSIWQTQNYQEWFNNYGASIGQYQNNELVGQPEYPMAKLLSYMTAISDTMIVDNVQGFPISGIIKIYSAGSTVYELIGYSNVNRETSVLSGLTRGANNTEAAIHLPGSQIYMDLLPIVLLDGSNNYAEPPEVTAYIDTTIYPEPREAAEFEVVMAGGVVAQINVINPGSGYAVTPEIRITPAEVFSIVDGTVNTTTNTLQVSATELVTGKLVRYVAGDTNIGGLKDYQWYYINVLSTTPASIIAFYQSYTDAMQDKDRVALYSEGVGTQQIEVGARAFAITTSTPIRENNITLRFDRTSYDTQVQDWTPNAYYAGEFVGYYTESSSSAIKLKSIQPDIYNILSSAEGTVFPIQSVTNDREITWSSGPDEGLRTVSGIVDNQIGLSFTASVDDEYPTRSTVGFTVGMPVKFTGDVSVDIVEGQTYYVAEIIDLEYFTISETQYGSPLTLSNYTPSDTLSCITGTITDTAVLTTIYPGIRQAVTTSSADNLVTVALTEIGTGGTSDLYTNAPVHFTGNVFGGIEENMVYYVVSVFNNQQFSLSETKDPVVITVLSTDSINQLNCKTFTDLNVNDPVVFDTMVINNEPVDMFGNIEKGKVYYIKTIGVPGYSSGSNRNVTISETLGGAEFVTGIVEVGEGTYSSMTVQSTCLTLTNDSGSMTMNIGIPLSPGQVDGQQFTFYPTSDEYVNITTSQYTNLIEETIIATTAQQSHDSNTVITGNKVALNNAEYLYSNIPFSVSNDIGGLYRVDPITLETKIYYATDLQNITVEVIHTGGNALTLNTGFYSDMMFEGMPITFIGESVGGVLLNYTYYVKNLIDDTSFSISTEKDGPESTFNVDNGIMLGTGSPTMQVYLPAGAFINGDNYDIRTVGTTDWASIGATEVSAPFTINTRYTIKTLGDTNWNTVAGTLGVTYAVGDQIVAQNVGFGTGVAYETQFTASGVGSGTGTAIVLLADAQGPVTWYQEIVSPAILDINYILGGYNVIISDGGIGFTQTNTITINGNLIGGTSPENDLILTVNQINSIVPGEYIWSVPLESNGIITNVICNGTPNSTSEQYYLKVESANSFKVYADSLFTQPVSGIDFPYEGFTTTEVSATNGGSEEFTVTSSDGFVVGDPIVFTGEVFGNVVLGQTYYIYDIPSSTSIKITEIPGGISFSPTTDTGTMTVTKAGSFMLLPQPFYFNPSIVKYNNRVWQCIVSNNDAEFTLGNWLLLNSGDRKLNALDRTKGYYQPTINMPGNDLTQLFTGLVYPNTTYLGNDFETDKQFALDTQLTSIPFNPTNISMPAVAFDGTNYLAPANLPNSAGIIANLEIANDWQYAKMSNQTLAFTDLLRTDEIYIMTSTNSPTPLFKSTDYQLWSTSGWFVPIDTLPRDVEFVKKRLITAGLSLNAVAEHNGTYVAVGKNILVSDDLVYWYETLVLEDAAQRFYDVAYVNITGFTGYVAVGANGTAGMVYVSEDGSTWTEVTPNFTQNCFSVVAAFDAIYITEKDVILSTNDFTSWPAKLYFSGTLKNIAFGNNTLVAVGEAGLCYVSTDGNNWVLKTTNTTENLNAALYAESRDEWTIVGDNNTILQTSDITASSVDWFTTQAFTEPNPEYTIIGDAFLSGYGPEEMVPGIVEDQLTMIVNTRPGTNWPATLYAHVGYNVKSVEYDINASNEYSFNKIVQTPATISVFKLINELSVTLYEGTDYTVDWFNKIVMIELNFGERLRIDIYEPGNGDQLVESSTDESPIITNETTDFDEIFLDCNYIGTSQSGGGIIVPETLPITVEATETSDVDNTMQCSDTTDFMLNMQVYFTGVVFGGVAIDTPYYIKTFDTVSNLITISTELVEGIAGPEMTLSSDTGSMNVVIQRGPGDFYTEPAVFYNGQKLISGHTNYVVLTSATNNSITTFTTTNLVEGQRIKFSNTIFGGIAPLTTYYIKQILSATTFTISETQGGSEFVLISEQGNAIFVTEDYAAALADNQVNAKIIFTADYNQYTDYISYAFLNNTASPSTPQYGYTIPLVQVFNGNGTVGPYDLTNYLGGTNVENAVVEVNGLRIDPSEYEISFAFQKLEFNYISPSIADTIAVTTFNDTDRQYMFTTSYDTTSKQVTPIAGVDNNITFTQPTTVVQTSIPHNLETNDIVKIAGVEGSSQLNDKTFVVNVLDSVRFEIYSYSYGEICVINSRSEQIAEVVTNVNSYIGGGYVWKYQSWMLENTYATENDSTYITVDNASELVLNTPVYFTEDGPFIGATVGAPDLQPGSVYRINFLGTTDWNIVAGTVGLTYAVGDIIYVVYMSLGTGTAEIYYPVNEPGYPLNSIPELITGQKYFIKEVDLVTNTISISETYGGDAITTMTANSGYSVRVTQWEQTNVNRLWVTVNGYRVASSSLRLDDANEVSILTEILPGDDVVITSMMPSATPDTQTYIEIVDQSNEGFVYRANPENITWNTEAMSNFSTTMVVHDISDVTYTKTQESVTPAAVDGYYVIGLSANKTEIIDIAVYNNNPSRLGYIGNEFITIKTSGLGPQMFITAGYDDILDAGDELTITITLGRLIYVNGEYMTINAVDKATNTLTVDRGALASPILMYIPINSRVYGLLEVNKMTNLNYNDTWNKIPGIYNIEEGDPLQIAVGSAPRFLRLNHEVDI